ncbi:MAG: hypothetical protein U1E26_06710 [Coriobacteriia bacterium]|nr:hypothetical protein [Coriobacteriia bacterium]
MSVALLAVAALLFGALGVQVVYARTFAAHANRTTKILWGLNITLLAALVIGLAWYAFQLGVN